MTTTEKTIKQERLEAKALYKLHEVEEYLKTSIRDLHTFLTITENTAVLGLLAYHKSSNVRVNLTNGKAKCGLYQSGATFSLTDGKMIELEDAITSYFKA